VGVECADVHEEHVRDVVAEERFRHCATEVGICGRGLEIAGFELSNGGGVALATQRA
jgi:hypothetical protein